MFKQVWAVGIAMGVLNAAAPAQQKAGDLDAVLRQMDAASANFRSAEADFKKDLFQRVVRETTTQAGTIYFLKTGGGLQMGAQIAPPGAKTLAYSGGTLQFFDQSTDHLTIVDARANQAQYESFLTLGFGGSGRDLEKAWKITDQGSETISDGTANVKTEKLDLVSKDPNGSNTFTHVTIWVDPARAVSLKQQFFTPSGDIQTATYSHIRYNAKVDTKKYAIKTDAKTTRDRR